MTGVLSASDTLEAAGPITPNQAKQIPSCRGRFLATSVWLGDHRLEGRCGGDEVLPLESKPFPIVQRRGECSGRH
jgi:hypothetical protein